VRRKAKKCVDSKGRETYTKQRKRKRKILRGKKYRESKTEQLGGYEKKKH
jgi:hypothetical protein